MTQQRRHLDAVIGRHLADLKKPGVLSVRPGWEVKRGWFTDKPAVVVTVKKKLAQPPPGHALPNTIEGVPVDVRQASKRKQLELKQPNTYASELRLAPDMGSVAHFTDERTVSGTAPAASASAHAMLATIRKPEISYTAPANTPLAPVSGTLTVHLSASPDAGWQVLSEFLAGTSQSLVVGLYDFTSKHVAEAVTALKSKTLKLVLDHPPKNPTADQTDEQTAAALKQAFGAKFTQGWALTKLDRLANAWIYPTSYHIKVAVRDHATVWLSSGNWNNSNQPDINPGSKAADAETARHRDRDWHVVIENTDLANTFEAYLLNDLTLARAHNNRPGAAGPPLTPAPLPSDKTPAFTTFFPSATVHQRMKITPLLTPDPGVYADAVKALIKSAKKTLYMQYQYIEMPKVADARSEAFVELIQAVIARQNAGVDTRIIMGAHETTGYLEQLKTAGLDVKNNVKIQNNVHNKGILVDGKQVLISSQNWSTDGTLYNRDAGVIINNATVATYFQSIFLHDWQHLSRSQTIDD